LAALEAIARVIHGVEEEFCDVVEDTGAHLGKQTDGRMYPPHESFEKSSGNPSVRLFMQQRHRTFVGVNGAIRIVTFHDTLFVDLPGEDGRTVLDFMEANYVCN
jgi:hypothetical protein